MSENEQPRQRRQRPLGASDPRRSPLRRQGLSAVQIAVALASQGGKCLVGGEPLGERYFVDHCHACAAGHGHDPKRGCRACFRGLVCMPHNTALGILGDDVPGLLKAARYVAHGVHGA